MKHEDITIGSNFNLDKFCKEAEQKIEWSKELTHVDKFSKKDIIYKKKQANNKSRISLNKKRKNAE